MKKTRKIKKIREKQDRLLRVSDSGVGGVDVLADSGVWPTEVVVSGDMELGKRGNPVTILVEDEVTGETLELNNVRSAFVIVEDSRRNTSGWLAMAVGGLDKLSEMLSFLSKTTLDSLKRLSRSNGGSVSD